MPFFLILLSVFVFSMGPFVLVTLLEKWNVSILRIALITAVIPVLSVLGVALNQVDLITKSHSFSGIGGIILLVNFIGCSLTSFIYQVYQNGYTWSYWITAIILNWLVLIALAVIFRQVSLHPRLQRVINTTFQIAAFLFIAYMAVKNVPSFLESIRYLRGQ